MGRPSNGSEAAETACTPRQRARAWGGAAYTFVVSLFLIAMAVRMFLEDVELGTLAGVALNVAVFGVPFGLAFLYRREVLRHCRKVNLERCRRLGLCPQCGYDLTGNVSVVCPECGMPVHLGG